MSKLYSKASELFTPLPSKHTEVGSVNILKVKALLNKILTDEWGAGNESRTVVFLSGGMFLKLIEVLVVYFSLVGTLLTQETDERDRFDILMDLLGKDFPEIDNVSLAEALIASKTLPMIERLFLPDPSLSLNGPIVIDDTSLTVRRI